MESLLPANTVAVAAGAHHTLALTAGYAVAVKDDFQRPFKSYGPFVKQFGEIYEKEVMCFVCITGGEGEKKM